MKSLTPELQSVYIVLYREPGGDRWKFELPDYWSSEKEAIDYLDKTYDAGFDVAAVRIQLPKEPDNDADGPQVYEYEATESCWTPDR